MNITFNKLNFTKTEARVLLILLAVMIAGLGLKLYVNNDTGGTNFDKEKADRIIKRSAGTLVTDTISKESKELTKNDSTETKSKKKSKKGENLAQKSININTASKDVLMQLPGVGKSTAEKIIEYRETQGSFKRIEDIMKIKGIGQKKFDKMKEFIITE